MILSVDEFLAATASATLEQVRKYPAPSFHESDLADEKATII
jgi:hypothetical protein